MKNHVIAFSFLALPLLTACDGNNSTTSSIANSFTSNVAEATVAEAAESPIEVSMTGGIDPSNWTPGEEATVTFSHFPKTIEGFKQIQQQIGGTPQGAVALQLIAFELYNQNTEAGTAAIALNNTDINVPSVMRRLPDIFGKNSLDESYPRKHIVATFLEGATPENGFNPTQPYTVTVRSHRINKYERSEILQGYVLYLEARSSGYSSEWRGCEVVRQKGSEYFKVSNSPSMYVQCMPVPFDAEQDYQGLN